MSSKYELVDCDARYGVAAEGAAIWPLIRNGGEDMPHEISHEPLTSTGPLKRIRALRDFKSAGRRVAAGSLGGWVEGEGNLSQEGDCWIFPGCAALGGSRVEGGAALLTGSMLADKALVGGYTVLESSLARGTVRFEGGEVSKPCRLRRSRAALDFVCEEDAMVDATDSELSCGRVERGASLTMVQHSSLHNGCPVIGGKAFLCRSAMSDAATVLAGGSAYLVDSIMGGNAVAISYSHLHLEGVTVLGGEFQVASKFLHPLRVPTQNASGAPFTDFTYNAVTGKFAPRRYHPVFKLREVGAAELLDFIEKNSTRGAAETTFTKITINTLTSIYDALKQ